MGDYVRIAIIGFLAVWLINRGLKKAGLSQYAA